MKLMLPTLVITVAMLPAYALAGKTDQSRITEKEGRKAATAAGLSWPAGLPVYDHVVILVEENKDYEEVVGQDYAPYLNQLKTEGASFTRMYGEEHFSQGNYFWLFSGNNQTVGFRDQVPTEETNHNYPFTAANLGSQLIDKGLSFKGYAESLPEIGFTGDTVDNIYARKHVPWTSFANIPNGSTVATSSNLRFSDFPKNPSEYHNLPTVAFVIPNLDNDMHNCETGHLEVCIQRGDQWLRDHIDPYYQWAKNNNSLLIVTFDENDDKRAYQGLTNPGIVPDDPQGTCRAAAIDRELCVDLENRVLTIFAGAHIKPGEYQEGIGITHVNILRTLEAMYGLPKAGFQQPNAAGIGIADDYLITDVFETAR